MFLGDFVESVNKCNKSCTNYIVIFTLGLMIQLLMTLMLLKHSLMMPCLWIGFLFWVIQRTPCIWHFLLLGTSTTLMLLKHSLMMPCLWIGFVIWVVQRMPCIWQFLLLGTSTFYTITNFLVLKSFILSQGRLSS